MTDKAEQLQKLREPFPRECIGKLPRGNIQLDFVGHADVTDRLLSIDIEWNWEPLAYDESGLPQYGRTAQGQPVSLWIKLTICGITRLGVGSVTAGTADAEKQLIGDALRNAAMRFGVALNLWAKGGLESEVESHKEDPGVAVPPQMRQQAPAPPQTTRRGPPQNGAGITEPQLKNVKRLLHKLDVHQDFWREFVAKELGLPAPISSAELSKAQAGALITKLKAEAGEADTPAYSHHQGAADDDGRPFE